MQGIEPVDALIVDRMSFPPKQYADPTIPVANPRSGDLLNALSKKGIEWPGRRFPVIRGSVESDEIARPADSDVVGCREVAETLALSCRLYIFFETMS